MFSGQRRSRGKRSELSPSGRFRRNSDPREALVGKGIQTVVLTLLATALLTLCFKAAHMVRIHFVDEYGRQAWALPVGIGIIFLFVAVQLFRVWRDLKQGLVEYRKDTQQSDIKEDS